MAVPIVPAGIFLSFLEENNSGSLSAGGTSLTAQNVVPMWGEAFDVFPELLFKLTFTTGIST